MVSTNDVCIAVQITSLLIKHCPSYPTLYCILVLPESVVLWVQLTQERTGDRRSSISTATTFIVTAFYTLSGVLGVVLFFYMGNTLFRFGRLPVSEEKLPALFPQATDSLGQPNRLSFNDPPGILPSPRLHSTLEKLPSATSVGVTPRLSLSLPPTHVLFDIVNRHVSSVERNAMTFHTLISAVKHNHEALKASMKSNEKDVEKYGDEYEQQRAVIDFLEK